MEESTKGLIRNLLLAIVLASIMVLVPQALGLGKQGFLQEDILKQFNFYINVGSVCFVLVLGTYFVGRFLFKSTPYGDSVCFASQGETPSIPFFKRFTTPQLFLICLIIFSGLGLINVMTKQQVFTGIGTLQQQFTKFDNIFYSSTLVVISENIAGALILALELLGLRLLGKKYKWSKTNFMILVYTFIPISQGIYGMINHLFRGYTDVDIFITGIFWSIGGLLTLLTGSFITFGVLHLDNNLIMDIKKLYSSDIAIQFTFGMLIVLIFIYLAYYVYWKRKKRKNNINNIYK